MTKLVLSKLHQISIEFYNFWQTDSQNDKIMQGTVIVHLT